MTCSCFVDPQPAKMVLVARRIHQTQVARDLGLSQQWVSDVLNSRRPAPELFRRRLTAYLGLPESELFR